MSLWTNRRRTASRFVSLVVLTALVLSTTGIGYAVPQASISTRRAPAAKTEVTPAPAPEVAEPAPAESVVRKVTAATGVLPKVVPDADSVVLPECHGWINVFKFEDYDGDGRWDNDEPPVSGWKFTLTKSGRSWTITTGSNGKASMYAEGGDWRVTEERRDGWTYVDSKTFRLDNDETENVYFGNHKWCYEKSMALTYAGSPVDATFYVIFKTAHGTERINLRYSMDAHAWVASRMVGWNAGFGIEWWMSRPSGDVMLGSTGPESIDRDTKNYFNYESSLRGKKFNDLNGNGVRDMGEPGLGGWTIRLYRGAPDAVGIAPAVLHSWIAETVTDADGGYSFTQLPPGVYHVEEVMQDGWRQTRAPVDALEIANGVHLRMLNFGNMEIDVLKQFKLTLDVVKPGVTFYADYTANGQPMTKYLAPDTDPKIFEGEETFKWGTNIGSVYWYAVYGTEHIWLGTTPGEKLTQDETVNEFYYDPLVGGHKFNDLDGDGVWDDGEPGLAGWTIQLWRVPVTNGEVNIAAADLYAETVTGEDGSYSFEGALPGVYFVTEVLQDGWEQTLAPEGNFPIENGTEITSLDFGNHEIIYDKTFSLTYAGAPAGATFSVMFMLNGEPMDIALEGAGPYTAELPVKYPWEIGMVSWYAYVDGDMYLLGETEGETLEGDTLNEFTYTASISGFKFSDDDGNGVWDTPAEVGLPGWTIGLYRMIDGQEVPSALPAPEAGFDLVASTVTGADGSYMFSGLLPGTYYVAEDQQDGWLMTVSPEGTFSVENGTQLTGLNFGNQEEALPFTDIDFSKSANKTTTVPGGLVTYTLTYKNIGDGTIEGITIVDDYDQRYMTPVDVAGAVVSGGKLTWTDAVPLTAGQQRSITYTMRVASDMPAGLTHIDNVALLTPGDHEASWRVDVTVGEPFLPFTGGDAALLFFAALASAGVGVVLRRRSA